MDAIEVDHLTKKFGNLIAVNDISFMVARGEIFGLLGPNGAGKTTLIRMMTTLTPPTSGTARIGGHDIVKDADGVRHVLGVIPQAFTSDPELTARENMLIHAKLYGVPSNQREALISQLLESVDLLKFANSLVRTFSGGMRRRLEIARGLVHSPEILFLDEPTTGLDPQARRQLWDLIEQFKLDGRTILLTTHYMDEAERLCDRVAIMDHGKVIALGTPRELIASIGVEHMVEFSAGSLGHTLDAGALRRLDGVRDVTRDNGSVQMQVTELHRAVPALLDELDRQHIPLTELRTHSATLEDVFVALTGRRLRDE
jgi:ABC-2 type transport system ATP-binding protein